MGGGVLVVPLKAFDVREEAQAYIVEREKFMRGLPPQAHEILQALGIAGLGLTIQGVPTNGPKRTIILAGPGDIPPPRLA
jgi:hypothetical protein